MTPGIVAALRGELSTLAGPNAPRGHATCSRLPSGALVALAGVGPERARRAAEALTALGAEALVSWGIAAGLDPALRPGALLIPESVVGRDATRYAVDRAWHARLHHSLAPVLAVHTGPLAEADGLLTTPDEKRALFERRHAGAADMESAALAAFAHDSGLPFLVVRAIADPAESRVPAWLPQVLDGAGRLRPGAWLARLVVRPGDWVALLRVGRHFQAARRTLERVTARAGTRLAAGP